MRQTRPSDSQDISIAILEDDPVITELISITLQQAGWEYQCFDSIAAIRKSLGDHNFDLYVLDWSLPDGEVDVVIKLIRDFQKSDAPILIESLNDDEEQIVKALELGADDYVVKPLRTSELTARISALLRRYGYELQSSLHVGRYQVDEANHQICVDDQCFELSAMEYRLAVYLFKHFNALLSREQLLNDVWQRNSEVDTRTVDAHISRLRKKLGFGPDTGLQLSTLRGYGYRLEEV